MIGGQHWLRWSELPNWQLVIALFPDWLPEKYKEYFDRTRKYPFFGGLGLYNSSKLPDGGPLPEMLWFSLYFPGSISITHFSIVLTHRIVYFGRGDWGSKHFSQLVLKIFLFYSVKNITLFMRGSKWLNTRIEQVELKID